MRIALYSGSFDPITNGHLDLIKRASKLCDELIIGVIENKSKTSFFTLEERVDIINQTIEKTNLKNIRVESFSGLLADYVNENGINAVIRGLRATMDFEYEIQMAQMNARLFNENVETVFLMTSPTYSFISSSVIKEVFLLNGDITGLVPESVYKNMEDKLGLK